MNISKSVLVFSLLLSSSFLIFSSSIHASVNMQNKVYGTRSNKNTNNKAVSDPTNQDKIVSTNTNKTKADSTPTAQSPTSKVSPVISKAPIDVSSTTARTSTPAQENLPIKVENTSSKAVVAVHPVKTVVATEIQASSSNALESDGYRASIYFKDGEKRDGTILSTSTNSIYNIRFVGEKEVKQYNVNSIARIERKGEGVSTKTTRVSSFSSVATVGEDYKASILFKDGSRRDGTILSTSTNNIYNIRFVGEKNVKQYNANTIERVEPKGSSFSVAPIVIPEAMPFSPTNKVTTSNNQSQVPDWKPYKALVYLRNGTKVDGTVIFEGVELVIIKVVGGSVIEVNSNDISKIDRT